MTTCWVCSEPLPPLFLSVPHFSLLHHPMCSLWDIVSLDVQPHLPKEWSHHLGPPIGEHYFPYYNNLFRDGHMMPTLPTKSLFRLDAEANRLSLSGGESQAKSVYFGLPLSIFPNMWLEPVWKRSHTPKGQNHETEVKIEMWGYYSSPWIHVCPKLFRLPCNTSHYIPLFNLFVMNFCHLHLNSIVILFVLYC